MKNCYANSVTDIGVGTLQPPVRPCWQMAVEGAPELLRSSLQQPQVDVMNVVAWG